MSEKGKKGFFTGHAKSSALVISLIIHACILVSAVSLVAITVTIQANRDPFAGKTILKQKPRIALRKVPIKTVQPKRRPIQRSQDIAKIVVKNIVSRDFIPAISGTSHELIADVSGSNEEGLLELTFPELNIDFLNTPLKGEKLVFLVHSGPATTGQTPRARLTYYALRKHLTDRIQQLPAHVLFNVAWYWQGHTTPCAPHMLLATPENKERVMQWGSTMNPLDSRETYGSSFDQTFKRKLQRLEWPEKLTGDDLPGFGPQWYYNYRCSPEVMQFYQKGAKTTGYENWARALCFALQQKPDMICVLCTDYVIPDDPGALAKSYKQMVRSFYGPDRKSHPIVNIIVLNKVGRDGEHAENNRSKFSVIASALGGEASVINDVRDIMTDAEMAELEALVGRY